MKPLFKNMIFIVVIILPIAVAVKLYFKLFLSEFPLEESTGTSLRQPNDFNDADYFIKFGYIEIKDLVKQMISLITAILIFSVTFSEKIVNFKNASANAKILLIVSWIMMILALVCDGIGLALNALAYPTALADNWEIAKNPTESSMNFYEPAMKALAVIVFSGVCFILSLIYLVAAGAWSMLKQ